MEAVEVNDAGIFFTVFERFAKLHLPRVIQIQDRIEQGLELNEFEIEFLSEVLHDSNLLFPYIDRHPECQQWFANTVHYYNIVVDQATRLNQGIQPLTRH
jgi:hypothetical protein